MFLYCSHLNLGTVVRLASLSRTWVKPVHRIARTQLCINTADIPTLSKLLNSTYDRHKSALIEIIQ